MEGRDIISAIFKLRRILIVVLTPILFLPLLMVEKSPEAKCAYVVIIMALYWITEALPIAVTALLPIVLFPLVGLMSAKTLSSQYINDTSTLFIGGLIVAAAIEHWNIHRRIALKILTIVGSEPRWLMLGLMLPTWFLSMWISNTATTAMMIPIANAILLQLKDVKQATNEEENNVVSNTNGDLTLTGEKQQEENGHVNSAKYCDKKEESDIRDSEDDPHHLRMCKAMSLCIAYSANCGGIGSLTGTGPNIVMKGQSDIVFENSGGKSPVTFATWMQFGLPLSAILLVILWFWMQVFFLRCRGCCSCCKDGNKDDEVNNRVKAVIKEEYDKLGSISFAQGAVLVHFILLAVLWITRDLGGIGGWGDIFPERNAISGLSAWVGDKLTVFSTFEPWVMNLILCYIVAAATEVTSNTAMATLMMPIMSQLAFKLNVNPLYFMFPTAIATSFAYMLPVATPPNAVVFSYGYVKVVDMVSAGFFMNIVAVPVLVMATETWGNSIFGFHTLPEIFQNAVVNVNSSDLLANQTCWCTNSTVNNTISVWINSIIN
ncbi:hypothetical protein KUTeg_010455 [Tegillarca granosa]|uniref:Solute carrier family 13 member 5 n=1 Tax=Tegillarca granosa TaxID=220873 RepID=A0ABQ9F9R2_TEGGR|nr:hypothetical protein KUTeg_010455 [Tegillarca granosa]